VSITEFELIDERIVRKLKKEGHSPGKLDAARPYMI
jgi:hypothetical protein